MLIGDIICVDQMLILNVYDHGIMFIKNFFIKTVDTIPNACLVAGHPSILFGVFYLACCWVELSCISPNIELICTSLAVEFIQFYIVCNGMLLLGTASRCFICLAPADAFKLYLLMHFWCFSGGVVTIQLLSWCNSDSRMYLLMYQCFPMFYLPCFSWCI